MSAGPAWERSARWPSLPEYRGRGLGSRLVKTCLEEAKVLGLSEIFLLTLAPDFFKSFGFRVVSREDLLPICLGRLRQLRQVPRLRRNSHAPGAGDLEITITDYLAFLAPWRELFCFTPRRQGAKIKPKLTNMIIGVAGLHIFWQDLGEIRSVAVLPNFQKTGIGSRLVHQCIEEARGLGLKKVFALTTRPDFFKRLGFKQIPNKDLPTIIWSECKNCLKYPDKCNEIPMLLELEATPAES